MKRFFLKYNQHLVLGLSSIYILFFSINRLIARDEGFYAIAIKKVIEGNLPYIDFFYPQMPLLPFLYAPFFSIFELNFINLRIFNSIILILFSYTFFKYLNKKFNKNYALLGLVLFVFSNFSVFWYSTTQTYLFSTFFLFLSLYFLDSNLNKSKNIIFAALFFSLAVQVRLFFAGLVPLYLIFIFIKTKSYKKICIFLIFGLISSIPTLYFLFLNFDSFFFNNLGYHLNRTAKSAEESFNNKLTIFKVIFYLKESIKFQSIQLPLLNFGLILSIFFSLFKRKLEISIFFSLALIILNLIPSPSYVQYFCTGIPFLIICFLFLLSNLNKLSLVVLIPFLFFYFYQFQTDIKNYTKTGSGVIGIRNYENAQNWKSTKIKEIAVAVNRHSDKDDFIWSSWPGYALETDAQILPGMENHFNVLAAKGTSKEDNLKYKITNKKEQLELLCSKKAKIIILTQKENRAKKYQKCLNLNNYKLKETIFKLYIYTYENN